MKRLSNVIGDILIRLMETGEPVPLKGISKGLDRKTEAALFKYLNSDDDVLEQKDGFLMARSRGALMSALSSRPSDSDWYATDVDGVMEASSVGEIVQILLEKSDQAKSGVMYLHDMREATDEIREKRGRDIELLPEEVDQIFTESGLKPVVISFPRLMSRVGYVMDGVPLEAATELEFGPGHEVDEETRRIKVLKHSESLVRASSQAKPGRRLILDEEGRGKVIDFAVSRGAVTTNEVVKEGLGIQDPGPGAKINSEVAILLKRLGFKPELRQIGEKKTKVFVMPKIQEPEPAEQTGDSEPPETGAEPAGHGDLDAVNPDWREDVSHFVREKDFTVFDEIAVRVLKRPPSEFDRYHIYRVAMFLRKLDLEGTKFHKLLRMVYHKSGRKPSPEQVQDLVDSLTRSQCVEKIKAATGLPDGITENEAARVVSLREALRILLDGELHSRRDLFREHFDYRWQLKILTTLEEDGYLEKVGDKQATMYRGIADKIESVTSGNAIDQIAISSSGDRPEESDEATDQDEDEDEDEDEATDQDEDELDEPEAGELDELDELRGLVADMFQVLKEHTDEIKALRKRVKQLETEIGITKG